VSRAQTSGLTLDTGALLALDHAAKAVAMQDLLKALSRRGGSLCIPAAVVAQAWRSPRQVRLARLIKSFDVEIAVMDLDVARSVGLVCAATGHHDVIDVHVALCARERGHAVVTSDVDDISRVDPSLAIISV
jgi:predicted nucleic acid-binding protein